MAQEPIFLGIVQVPIANLHFNENFRSRQRDRKQVHHLETLFNKTAIEHQDRRHWIDGYVDRSDADSILEDLGGLPALKHYNVTGRYPFLADHRVVYTHGRHRVEASKKVNSRLCWTTALYSTDLLSLASNQLIQKRTDQFHHEAPYTNGHIYSKLYEYPINSRDYNEWHMRLSPNKQKNLQAIYGHSGVSKALNKIVCFPGIIDALYLGNVCKYSAWGLFNEFQMCLDHIYHKWFHYTRGNSDVQREVSPETVKLLEGRAPATCLSDREWVRAVFRARMVFPTITDQKQRTELESSILRSQGVIPSLRSCQANMLYLGIAAQIVWSLLVPNDPELKRIVKAEDGAMTLRSVLRKCWTETEPYVEVEEGKFQSVFGGPNFDLAYNTIIVAALRQFAFMSRDGPKVEAGDLLHRISTADMYSCEALFHRRAKLLGFRSHLIEQGTAKMATPFRPEKHTCKTEEEAFFSRVEHRWGRPFARMFPIIQDAAFLPRILSAEIPMGTMTELFILKDFVESFLPPVSFNIDFSRPVVNLNHAELPLEPSASRQQVIEQAAMVNGTDITQMEVDTPPQTSFWAEDVTMSDSVGLTESEMSEGSHFWEHLITEYQSLNSDGDRSDNPCSDAPTLFLDDRQDEPMADSSSVVLSLPSYSIVADQSRTVFNDSTPESYSDASTIWPLSGSERCSRRKLVTQSKEPLVSSRDPSEQHSTTGKSNSRASRKQTRAYARKRPQRHLPGCSCSICGQSSLPDVGRRSQLLPSTYSTSPERSVLLSPSVEYTQPQSRRTTATTMEDPDGRLTWMSFCTDPHQRSTLPSPRVMQTSTVERGGITGVTGSGQSALHSQSIGSSPVLSGFNSAVNRLSRGRQSFRPDVNIVGWQGFIDSDDTLTTLSSNY